MLIPSPPPVSSLTSCGLQTTNVDFSRLTNPSVALSWTDASGSSAGGSMIPTITDDWPGALPQGSVRFHHLGSSGGTVFDLLVTVPAKASEYSSLVNVQYSSPSAGVGSRTSQAVLTDSGFACLGVSVRPSYCASGSALEATTATCADGTPTTIHGSEFEMRFVEAGTEKLMDPFRWLSITMIDVDGEVGEWSDAAHGIQKHRGAVRRLARV
mgnify:CR=1 FL=1